MTHVATVKITRRGGLLLPQEFRDVLGSDVVMAEIGDNNNVVLYPYRDVAEAFKNHSKNTNIPFEQMRKIAWTKAMARYKPRKQEN